MNPAPVPEATERTLGQGQAICGFLWVHSNILAGTRKVGIHDKPLRLLQPADTPSASQVCLSGYFKSDVVISCLCYGPGRWTTAVVAVIYLYSSSLHPQLGSCMTLLPALWCFLWIAIFTKIGLFFFYLDLDKQTRQIIFFAVLWTYKTKQRWSSGILNNDDKRELKCLEQYSSKTTCSHWHFSCFEVS